MELWEKDLREKLLKKRGRLCEICGVAYATEMNHCLVHDKKNNKKLHRLLTCEENLQLVCSACHAQKGHTRENKIQFANEQVKRGYNISEWYSGLPFLIKENWLENIKKE